MKDLLLILLHLAVVTAKLCGPGGARAVIAENLVLTQQLIVLRRGRLRERLRKVAIAMRHSTRMAFHQTFVRRAYHRLFSSRPCPRSLARRAQAKHSSKPSLT